MQLKCYQVDTQEEGPIDCLHLDEFCREDPDHHHVEGCPKEWNERPEYKMAPSFNEYVVKVNLIVKAPGKQEAENFVAVRMGGWMGEPSEPTAGYGYPDGTLLLYTFAREKEDVKV